MRPPILFSFRRCPYAMRARMALVHCGIQCIVREVALKAKPAHLLEVSNKGTVPVLLIESDDDSTAQYRVIDESIDIMVWAMTESPSRDLAKSDHWLAAEILNKTEIRQLIEHNDTEFKTQLDKYKYSDRHPQHPQAFYLEQAMPFLEQLENLLSYSTYLGGDDFRFPDAAILPFVRQFSMVDPTQFNSLTLPNLQRWVHQGINSALFLSVMRKFLPWAGLEDTNVNKLL